MMSGFAAGRGTLDRMDKENAAARYREIVSAIKSRDAHRLRAMFSRRARESIPDFDRKLEALVSFCGFDIREADDLGGPSSERSRRTGRYRVDAIYDLLTSEGAYRLSFIDVISDELDGYNVGLTMLGIVSKDYSDSMEYAWPDENAIFIPETGIG